MSLRSQRVKQENKYYRVIGYLFFINSKKFGYKCLTIVIEIYHKFYTLLYKISVRIKIKNERSMHLEVEREA